MIHNRLNFASESSAVVRELFLYFTRSHHFCSIVSDMARNCSNCGALGINIDPCEYCRMLPQCRKCRRRMPSRCFAKSTTANICEVRHVLSVSIVWTFPTLHMNKLVSLYYKFLHMSCRIAMRGSCDTKSWSREQRWMVRTKSANSSLFRAIATFGPSSIATQNQLAKQSRGLCSDTGTYDFFL